VWVSCRGSDVLDARDVDRKTIAYTTPAHSALTKVEGAGPNVISSDVLV